MSGATNAKRILLRMIFGCRWFKDLMSVSEPKADIANLMVQWRRWFQPSQG